MEVQRLSWLGVRTGKFDDMVAMLRDVLGLRPALEEPGRVLFMLPNGDPIDIFDKSLERYDFFTTGPVVGFLVDDVDAARDELKAAGVEVLGPVQRAEGFVWAHFRGPDGNLYELQGREPAG